MNRRTLLLHIAIPVASLAVAIIVWHFAAQRTETFILPSPGQVFDALVEDWSIIGPALWVTLKLTLLALLILAFIVAFFPILTNTAQGLKSVDHNLHNLFDLYGARRWQTLMLLRAPSALPYFLTGLRIAGGLALIAAVVAEFAAGSGGRESGLAYRILEAQFWLDTPRAFAALFMLALTGVAIFAATSAIAHFAMRRWHESAAEREN